MNKPDYGQHTRTTPPTDADVIAAVALHVKAHQTTMKYSALVDALTERDGDRAEWLWLYSVVGPITQKLKAQGKLELIKGRGAGWTVPRKAGK